MRTTIGENFASARRRRRKVRLNALVCFAVRVRTIRFLPDTHELGLGNVGAAIDARLHAGNMPLPRGAACIVVDEFSQQTPRHPNDRKNQ